MSKVAVIGLGRWGKVLLKELKEVAEVKYECDSQTDLNTVFDDPEVRAVFIATPTPTHFEIAKKALGNGKHMFLEKPGTTNSGYLKNLIELAKEKSLKFAVGYEFAHHPVAQKLKKLLSSKKVVSIRFEWFKWGTFKDDAVHHLLCHEISIAQFLGIHLRPFSCTKTKVVSDSDIVETKYEGNISSIINRASPIKQKIVTISTIETTYIWNNNDLFEVVGEELRKIEVPEYPPVGAEVKDFLNSIEEDREPMVNGEFALDVYKTIELAQASTLR